MAEEQKNIQNIDAHHSSSGEHHHHHHSSNGNSGEHHHHHHHHHHNSGEHSGEHHHHHHHDPTSEFRAYMKRRAKNKKIIEHGLLILAWVATGAVLAALFFAYFIDK